MTVLRSSDPMNRQQTGCDLVVTRRQNMRCAGQGHEIEIALPDGPLDHGAAGPLTAAFEAAYARVFSRPVPGMEIEILNWAVQVSTVPAPPEPPASDPAPHIPAAPERREVFCDITGRSTDAAFIQRDALAPGDRLPGPALIVERQTTTFVGADFTAHVDRGGNLVLTSDWTGG